MRLWASAIFICFSVYRLSCWLDGQARRHADVATTALLFNLYVLFFVVVGFTIVMPDAYRFSKQAGRDATASGLLIGLHEWGTPIGAALAWALLRRCPQAWRHGMRYILLGALSASIVGALAYIMVGRSASNRELNPFSSVLLARVVIGIGSGIGQQLIEVHIAHLAPVESRPEQMQRLVFVKLLAIGLGPCLGATASVLGACARGREGLSAVGFIQVAMSLGALLGVSQFYPGLDTVQDWETVSDAPLQQELQACEEQSRRCKIIVASLILDAIRCYAVGGLEAAATLILEEPPYEWSNLAAGIGVSLSFLCAIPIRYIYILNKDRLSAVTWMRVLMVLASFTSVCFFDAPCMQLGHLFGNPRAGACLFLFGVSLNIPSMWLANSVNLGIQLQNLLPEGSCCDINYVTLWTFLLGCGIGRFGGPPMARWSLQIGSQNLYAVHVLGICTLYMLVAEICLRPLMPALVTSTSSKSEIELS